MLDYDLDSRYDLIMDENVQASPKTQPLGPKPEEVKNPKSKLVPALLVITLLLIAGLGFVFLNSKKSTTPKLSQNTATVTQPDVQMKTDVELKGTLQKLSEDLGLIIPTEMDLLNDQKPIANYYKAGVFQNGEYKGYTRYIAATTSNTQVGYAIYIFASADNKKYILDSNPADASYSYEATQLDGLNKSKIKKVTSLESSHPLNENWDSRFALNRNQIIIERKDTGKKDKFGNNEQEILLITDFSTYSSLKSPSPQLKFFAGKIPTPYHVETITPTPLPEDQFATETTQIIVVDSTGLAYSYDLTSPQKATSYAEKLQTFNNAITKIQKSKSHSTTYPDYPIRPGLALTKSEIQTTAPTYDKYNLAIPQSCATDVNTTIIKGVKDQDLQKIGTSSYGDIFILSNKNHPLIKVEYDKKLGIYNDPLNAELYAQVNKGITKPSFDEYINKNPLVFFKDYWGRWVALGEYDINLPGGCGKPVVYLYPTKPTEVSVKFLTPITFDVSIPSYKNGWNVLAQPDGTLKDLQPEFTRCEEIDISKKGAEYARSACESNQYPYLYWAGQSTEKQYPAVDKGWIVENKNLSAFLSQQLDEVGFNKKEKSDFLEYWLPEMQSKKANYYRISFLQTAEMNSIAPMQIIPQPKNVYRLFLDYSAFTNKPASIAPQNLSKIVRDGFTVVEWGGLKGVSLR